MVVTLPGRSIVGCAWPAMVLPDAAPGDQRAIMLGNRAAAALAR